MATTTTLVENAWPALDGTTTFQDARSCRETAKAYTALQQAGVEMSHKALQSEYLKQKNTHRGVYDSQKCQLMAVLDMQMTDKQKKQAATVKERSRLANLRAELTQASKRKIEAQIRTARNKVTNGSAHSKQKAKERDDKWKSNNPNKKYRGGSKHKKIKSTN